MSDPWRFPDDFMFGASTAAHQTEGNNVNSDWWDFERQTDTPVDEPSGDACDSYHRYRQDIRALADFGLDTYRFSVEWARIEPTEGEFSQAEIAHYRRMLAFCHELGVTPVLTYHHFTLPRWLDVRGGFLAGDFPHLFQRYVARVSRDLGDLFDWSCTINEPEGAGDAGWIIGVHPPGIKGDHEAMWQVTDNVFLAHQLAVQAVHDHCGARTGITLALQDMQYEDGAERGETPWENNARVSERYVEAAERDDFIGLQTYTRIRFGPEGQRGPGLNPEKKNAAGETNQTTQVGWEFYPQALAGTIRHVASLGAGKPILLTENGIATTNDAKRVAYIDHALRAVQACLVDGIAILGYLHWSLLDNYEWSAGYRPRFGLVEVDRHTFARRPKPSGYFLGQVARSRHLPAQQVEWPPGAMSTRSDHDD